MKGMGRRMGKHQRDTVDRMKDSKHHCVDDVIAVALHSQQPVTTGILKMLTECR